jgi:hypothetical protein
MAVVTQEVLIDFQVNSEELDTLDKKLDNLGVPPEVAKQFTNLFNTIKSGKASTSELISQFKAVATTATKLGKSVEDAFGAGIQDALAEAGVSFEEFKAAIEKADQPVKTLKKELKELKEALALAKVNGEDTGAEFEALRARAGALSDAIADAGAEIKNAGSDTRNFDNIVGSIGALAGGFSAVQGAAALFGEENEDLQKALLKVNAAMALATGLQQIQTAVQKEGALAKLSDSVATGVQTATQRLYTLATGQATAATVAFKVALAATGIGLVVVAVLALVSALNDTEVSLEDVNRQLANQQDLLESSAKLIDRQTQRQILLAKEAGAAESDLIRIRSEGLVRQFEDINKTNKALGEQRDGLKSTSEAYAIINKQIEENKEKQAEIGEEIKNNNIEGRIAIKQESEDRKKAIDENAKKQKEAAEKAAAQRKANILAGLNDELAAIEKRLLFAEKGSSEELDLKKKAVDKKRDIDLQGEKLTENQIKLIKAKAYSDRLLLDKEFNDKATEQQLQAQIDTNTALLAGISVNNETRLQLLIENINTAAQLEINAAEGNAAKILSIQAKQAADIRALKNKAIDDELAAQESSVAKTNEIVKTGLTKLANDNKQSLDTRIAAIKGIEAQELLAVDRAIAANDAKEQSDEDYQANYKRLAEERAAIEQGTFLKIAEARKSDTENREENLKDIANLTIDIASQVADFFSQLASLAAEQDQQRIDQQKAQLQSLVEAGAITAKQASVRAKEIEVQERQARQRQAQREKSEAVFRALLAIPSAVLKGLSTGGPVLAAIYGALAAAQAAIVISRPVPKFFIGKKGNYEGRASVAEIGAEIVERDGGMYLYTKPTETYLKASDKVYTAAETRGLMHNSDIKPLIQGKSGGERFDYDKLAKAIPQSSFSVNIDKDFIEESVAKGLTRHFNNRYKFN